MRDNHPITPPANPGGSTSTSSPRSLEKPPSTRPAYKHKPFYAYLHDDGEDKGGRAYRTDFRVRRFKGFLFDEDLMPAKQHTHEVDITYDGMLDHLHGQIRKGLYLCSEMREGPIQRVDSTKPSDLFVQDGAMCSAYATWQFLYSALWEYLDDWTRTFLNSLIQYQESLRLPPRDLPARFVRTRHLKARPEIMMTYYADSDDDKERRDLMTNIRQLTADLKASYNYETNRQLIEKNNELGKLDSEWEESVTQVPWYSSFTRLLRAHLACLNDGPDVFSISPDQESPLEVNLLLPSGLSILSLHLDKLVGKRDTWKLAESTVQKFRGHFNDKNKGLVKGSCVRCVIPGDDRYDHFITYIDDMWYDNGGDGTKTNKFTELRHFTLGGSIEDLHIIFFKL